MPLASFAVIFTNWLDLTTPGLPVSSLTHFSCHGSLQVALASPETLTQPIQVAPAAAALAQPARRALAVPLSVAVAATTPAALVQPAAAAVALTTAAAPVAVAAVALAETAAALAEPAPRHAATTNAAAATATRRRAGQ